MLISKIFELLTSGKVINNYKLSDVDVNTPCPLYNEINTNLDDYKEHYLRCGYELIDIGGSYFLKSITEEKSHLELASKIHALLIVIGRALTLENYEIGILFDSYAGLNKDTADKINEKEEFRLVLNAARIKENLWDECKKLLVDRNVAAMNRAGNIVLLASGKKIYEQLTSKGSDSLFSVEPKD